MQSSRNFYEDIKNSIFKHFSFLKEEGFSECNEEQIAYEYHFVYEKNELKIDISFEAVISTPIWVQIRGIHIHNFDKKNILGKYSDLLGKLYTNTSINSKKQINNYNNKGYLLNDDYLEEVAQLIKSDKNILNNVTLYFDEISKKINEQIKNKDLKRRREKEILTCEFEIIEGLVFEHEAKTIEEIRDYLKSLNEKNISNVKVYDWNDNRINFAYDNS